MTITDFNSIFSGNLELVNRIEKISLVFDLKNNNIQGIIDNQKKYDETEIKKISSMGKREFKNYVEDTDEKIRSKNQEILANIANYIKFMRIEKKHPIDSINISTILEIAEKNKFSSFLIISLFFALSNDDDDMIYIKKNIMDKYELDYNDVIYFIYTNNVLNKETTLFIRNKIKEIIKRNYTNEKIINAIYLAVQNNILTGEGRDVKFISSLIKSIPDFWKDIKNAGISDEIIALLEITLKKK